jgi:hypothetical protein
VLHVRYTPLQQGSIRYTRAAGPRSNDPMRSYEAFADLAKKSIPEDCYFY